MHCAVTFTRHGHWPMLPSHRSPVAMSAVHATVNNSAAQHGLFSNTIPMPLCMGILHPVSATWGLACRGLHHWKTRTVAARSTVLTADRVRPQSYALCWPSEITTLVLCSGESPPAGERDRSGSDRHRQPGRTRPNGIEAVPLPLQSCWIRVYRFEARESLHNGVAKGGLDKTHWCLAMRVGGTSSCIDRA